LIGKISLAAGLLKMKNKNFLRRFFPLLIIAFLISGCHQPSSQEAEVFTDFVVNPQESHVELFWKDDNGNVLRSIENLKKHLEKNGRRLRFAMNGGMFQENNQPLGLFIQNQKTITPLNTRNGEGNFYLQPNGVFSLTTNRRAFIKRTQDFDDKTDGQIEFATQSGPLLVIDGAINPQFKQGSENLYVRNGVCVLEDGSVFFSISRRKVNFYDFAEHFQKAGCRNALYLDGFVSRMYLPEKNVEQTDGDFGVIIGVAE
jgi:uncharacterized protein YigE (DUF2233 family)